MKNLLLLMAVLSLCCCQSKALECNSPELDQLIKNIIWKSIHDALPDEEIMLSQQDFNSSISIEYARPTAYDEVIKKYSCAGTVHYLAPGIPEFGKSLDEKYSRYEALKDARKESVRSPLRYSALSVLTDNTIILNEILNNSNATGYKFETVFSSQKVGDDDIGEISLSRANTLALYVVGALFTDKNKKDQPSTESGMAEPGTKEEQGYKLSGQEKGIIARSLADFQKTYKELGVSGVVTERDRCYQAAAGIKDRTLTLQCVSYDYISTNMISAVETANSFPATDGFTEADVKIRALESIENSIPDTLSTSRLRETFLRSIKLETEEQISHEIKKVN